VAGRKKLIQLGVFWTRGREPRRGFRFLDRGLFPPPTFAVFKFASSLPYMSRVWFFYVVTTSIRDVLRDAD